MHRNQERLHARCSELVLNHPAMWPDFSGLSILKRLSWQPYAPVPEVFSKHLVNLVHSNLLGYIYDACVVCNITFYFAGSSRGFGGVRSSTSDKRSAFIVRVYLPPDQGTLIPMENGTNTQPDGQSSSDETFTWRAKPCVISTQNLWLVFLKTLGPGSNLILGIPWPFFPVMINAK